VRRGKAPPRSAPEASGDSTAPARRPLLRGGKWPTMYVMTERRQLIVMRHAKAGELPGGPDFERALRPRGCKNASAAGRWLAGRRLLPDLVLCSSARRAMQTWQYVSEELGGEPEVIIDSRLYGADAREVLGVIAEAGAEAGPRRWSLMYVGHNPAAMDATEILIGEPADFPTSGIAIIDVTVPWPDLASGKGDGLGTLVASWAPRA
jgi:phosphohistidine phosphatase